MLFYKKKNEGGDIGMSLSALLAIRPGVTAVIGGGGKTTLLSVLGRELSARGRVVLCTTTKIFPFPGIPCAKTAEELAHLAGERLICTGTEVPDTGKLTVPPVSIAQLAREFDYVLAEADGSAGRPLKAHAPHEPVIPPEAGNVILVVGASGFGRPIREAAHRPERYAALAGAGLEESALPAMAAAVARAEGLHDRVYINQAETPSQLADAKRFAQYMDCPVLAGSLQREEYQIC